MYVQVNENSWELHYCNYLGVLMKQCNIPLALVGYDCYSQLGATRTFTWGSREEKFTLFSLAKKPPTVRTVLV